MAGPAHPGPMTNQNIVSYNNALNRYQTEQQRNQSSQAYDTPGGGQQGYSGGGGGLSASQAQALVELISMLLFNALTMGLLCGGALFYMASEGRYLLRASEGYETHIYALLGVVLGALCVWFSTKLLSNIFNPTVAIGLGAAITAVTFHYLNSYAFYNSLDTLWKWVAVIAVFILYMYLLDKILERLKLYKKAVIFTRLFVGTPFLFINLFIYSNVVLIALRHYDWITTAQIKTYVSPITSVVRDLVISLN